MTSFLTEDRVSTYKTRNDNLNKITDYIIGLHHLAREIEDFDIAFKVRMIADQLARVGNEYNENQLHFNFNDERNTSS